MSPLPYNKVCEIEDFAHDDLAPVIREVCRHKLAHFPDDFPAGAEHRKDWEVAMAVRTLDELGALRPDSLVLGVGAGIEDTLFHLARRVKLVFATDRYYGAGEWGPVAPELMLVEPSAVAPFDFDVNRLVVQHMDGRWLRYPDETFDGIFSSGSIEHFGEFEDVAASAHEMGRVLKPGGILSLSTEFRLSGPPDGIGWPGMTLVFSPENLGRHIVEASGLELVDPFVPVVSEATLMSPRDLGQVIAQRLAPWPGPEFTNWEFPHLVLVQEDYVFCSVHLALRKTARYPAARNEWAKPSPALRASISRHNRSAVLGVARPAPDPTPDPHAVSPPGSGSEPPYEPMGAPPRPPEPAVREDRDASQLEVGAGGVGAVDELLRLVDEARDEVDERLAALRQLRTCVDERTGRADVAGVTAPSPGGRTSAHDVVGAGLRFTAVIDDVAADAVSRMLVAPGTLHHHHTVRLMLELVEAGDRVLDLGAHVGTFSLAAAAKGCGVVAVEASPSNAALLRASVVHNGFHAVRVVNAAVSDQPGSVSFLPDGPHGHVAWDDADDGVVVPSLRVDDLLAEVGWEDLTFVKIDVEGSETRTLAGMRGVLSGPEPPPVLFESNGHTLERAGTSPGELFTAFEAYGYVLYVVDPGRLTRIRSSDLQPETVIDCLAVKRRPRGLGEWLIVPELTAEDWVRRAVGEMRHRNPDCRAWIARTLRSADRAVLGHPDVAAALRRLMRDADLNVRLAAAWAGATGREEDA